MSVETTATVTCDRCKREVIGSSFVARYLETKLELCPPCFFRIQKFWRAAMGDTMGLIDLAPEEKP